MPAKAGISSGGGSNRPARDPSFRWGDGLEELRMRGGWTYIVTNRPHGVLYVGVTSDLAARIVAHREGRGSTFCRRYNCSRLVLAEPHDTIEGAIAREKAIKAWKRSWKVELIEATNAEWRDLYDHLA